MLLTLLTLFHRICHVNLTRSRDFEKQKILPITFATIAKKPVCFFSFEQENSTTRFIYTSWLEASTTFASTLRSSSLAVSLSIHARRGWQLLSVWEFKTAPHHLVHLSLYTGQSVLGHDGSLCYEEKNDWVAFASPKRIIARGTRRGRCAAWISAQQTQRIVGTAMLENVTN